MSPSVGFSLLTFIPGRIGGSESYVRGLLSAFGGSAGITVLANRYAAEEFDGRLADGLSLHRVSSYRTGGGGTSRALAMLGALAAPRLVARDVPPELDVMHYPLTVPIPKIRARTVVTLHDVQHRELPEFFSRAERLYRLRAYDGAARHADRVITVSEHARSAAIEHLGLDPAGTRAIHLGIDQRRFRPGPIGEDAVLLEPLGLPPRFVLYPANLWPHKNHARLLEALALVGDRELALVLTGEPYGRLPELTAHAARLGLSQRVRHLGYVATATLPALYRAATALVFPSLYEGFGGPPLEAMACGCPVAAATSASLPEVCGDAALMFNPHDTDAIGAAIEKVTTDVELREQLRRHGLERAPAFTWQRAAAAHMEVYRDAAG